MIKRYLVTAALPYANGPLHFGHVAGCYLPADCYTRFLRLCHQEVIFISGSDEYGIAISLNAELARHSEKEHIDYYYSMHRRIFSKLGISFDHYSRTSWKGHPQTVYQFFKDLQKNGYIEEKVGKHLYSEVEKRFLADRYVIGTCPKCLYEEARGDECPSCGGSFEAGDLIHPRSKLTNAPLTMRSSTHWYLCLDRMKKPLAKWLRQKDWKSNVIHFAENYIQDLKPRAITRDLHWGIPFPDATGKVFYVWFDAPIGYISATKEWAEKIGQPYAWENYWLDSKTSLVQFIGKDNIPFHAIIFPAMIMGQNIRYKLVDELPANEFYHLEGKKFNKSSNWFIDINDFLERYDVDQLRYTLAANAPEHHDSSFTWQDFFMRCNAELVGKYGNFVHRVLTFIQQHLNGIIPEFFYLNKEDRSFIKNLETLLVEGKECYSTFCLRKASQIIMEMASLGNQYFDRERPWKLIQESDNKERLHTILHLCLRAIQYLALLSYPIMPGTSERLWILLGETVSIVDKGWDTVSKRKLMSGRKLPIPHRLFKKLELEQIKKEESKLQTLGNSENPSNDSLIKSPTSDVKTLIDFSTLDAVDLRVGEILSAEKVPKTDSLLQLQVDVGFEKRTIISGIAKFYEPSDLIGKKVIVVLNLAVKKIRGIESQGMLLAASDGNIVELPLCETVKVGSRIS